MDLIQDIIDRAKANLNTSFSLKAQKNVHSKQQTDSSEMASSASHSSVIPTPSALVRMTLVYAT